MKHRGETIRHTEDEAHFLRRLGGALIVQWDEVPAQLQELLVQQAADMTDPHQMVQGDAQIRALIEAHKDGDLRRS